MIPCAEFDSQMCKKRLVSKGSVEKLLVESFNPIPTQARAALAALFQSVKSHLCGQLIGTSGKAGQGLKNFDERLLPDQFRRCQVVRRIKEITHLFSRCTFHG